LAVASISHSGAIASIRFTILKEAVCFLLVTEIGNFIRAASRNFLQWKGAEAPRKRLEAIGFWPP
jgi:hypothetical protein